MPRLLAFDGRESLAFERARDQDRWLTRGGTGGGQALLDVGDVMSVDDDRLPAERIPPRGDAMQIVAELGRLALAERIRVDDRAEVVELVMRGGIGRLPDRAFGNLAVAEQDIGAVSGADAPGVQRDADRGADALSERPGGHVDERQPRRGMAFEVRLERPQLHQPLARKEPGLGPGGVENRRRMSLRQHEAIVVRVLGVLRIEVHLREEQHRHDVGGREAGGRMSAPRLAGRGDRIDPELCGDVPQCSN